MVFDEPRYRLGLHLVQAKPRANFHRNFGPGNRVILGASLGHVMQKKRDIEDPPVSDHRHDFMRDRQFIRMPPRLDFRQRTNRPDQMFVDRIMMIHIKLHHRDDTPEFGNEPPEQSCLVHPAQYDFRRTFRDQYLDKKPVCLGIRSQLRVGKPERLGHKPRGVRMDRTVENGGKVEQSDEIDRIGRKHILPRNCDALILDHEILRLRDGVALATESLNKTIQHRRWLGVLGFECRTHNRC